MTLSNLHEQSHEAYSDANRIDHILNEELNRKPINKDNIKYWETLIRTLQTSLALIESEVSRVRYL